MSYVDAAMDSILGVIKPGDLVVGKSTVPVGTAERLAAASRRPNPTPTCCGTPSSCVRDTLSTTHSTRIASSTA